MVGFYTLALRANREIPEKCSNDPDHESYLLELVRYIHRNPYKKKLEEAIGLYPWSSWEAYTTRLKKWKWVETQSILARFSGNREEQIAAFILFVQGETADEIRRLIETSPIPIALGGRGFLEWIQKTFFDKKHPQIPQSRAISPPRATILSAVQTFYHCSESTLFKSRRGVSNEPRRVAMYLLRELRGEPLLEIGELFGLSQYSSVSSVIQNVRHRLNKDKPLVKRITSLINTIKKGQT